MGSNYTVGLSFFKYYNIDKNYFEFLKEFDIRFTEAKIRRSFIDFSDLEKKLAGHFGGHCRYLCGRTFSEPH